MIRIVNIVALAITVLVAFGLYKLKYNTLLAEQNLGRLKGATAAESEALKVVSAEWSHLNSPQRIQDLAQKHLTLQSIDPSQVVNIKDIPLRPAAATGDLVTSDPKSSSIGGPELPLDKTRLQQIDMDNKTFTRGGNADG